MKTLELEQTINGFASGSNFITTDANGNKTVREATNEDIAADSLKGVGLAGGLTAVNTRVDNLAKDIDDALDEQNQTNEEVKTAITTNGTHIAEVATGVNDLNKSVAEMGKEISTKFDEVDSEISKASSELSESIEKVSEDVTAVNTRVDSLAQDTADAKAAAKAAEDKVTELSSNVDSKVKEAKDAADKVASVATAVTQVQDAVAQVATHEAAIAKNSARIDSLDKNVANLRKETRQGLAEQAALSGLFQPYNVGRFNVTAAVGGYKSESAVAIGTGFRFTENFAAKAGVAVGTSSGSSAAYHVGVNYEW